MKILFAVNNDDISDAIVKKFQKDYKEIISCKNVYYFNAILKELQNDKSYDRIVISEDLEPFANNNYDSIDKFIFEKLDRISDEATKANGEKAEIVLICTDRRSASDEMLTKLFGIGIYNAIFGDERTISNVCQLMYQPRSKKDAKIAYRIEGNDVGYQAEGENSVSESEVQNILAHYKRLGKNEDKYVDSFNNIVSQYTDSQLKIIIKYLPLNVKAVLEERSPKYQQLSTFASKSGKVRELYTPPTLKTTKQEEKINVRMLDDEKDKITKPIVIPSTINSKKIQVKNTKTVEQKSEIIEEIDDEVEKDIEDIAIEPKRGRGRPRKNPVQEPEEEKPKKGRGRPKKETIAEQENDEEFDMDLFNISDEDETHENPQTSEPEEDMDFDLFNMDLEENDEEENEEEENETMPNTEPEVDSDEDIDLFNINNEEDQTEQSTQEEDSDIDELKSTIEQESDEDFSNDLFSANNDEEKHELERTVRTSSNLSTLLTQEKKIVSFVGTTKNGTSFVVNNLALTLASMNISTAILDMTKSKNAYYIYTKNEERLRMIAENSIVNLEKGVAEGINVDKNLTVYTEIPGENKEYDDIEKMLVTLMEKHDVVLIDSDFNTPIEIFENSQEIYLVQSMDILTIQPLTAFLRNLKTKNVLRQEKLKVVINKAQRIGNLSDRILIGGISSYNDPAMTFMTELFDKDNIMYCKIPFENQNYVAYLDSLVNCEISLKGYTRQLIVAFKQLAEMVYPLLNKTKYAPKENKKRKMQFSDQTRDILNKMKNNY